MTDTVLMVRPLNFKFNEQTAATNIFQSNKNSDAEAAIIEFDNFVFLLRNIGIEIMLFDEIKSIETPDCIFPNNWFATIYKKLFLFPMLALNRRMERRTDIVNQLEKKFNFQTESVLIKYENEKKYLEGTGSVVLDRKNKIAYCNLSSRSNEEVLNIFCQKIGYESIKFSAQKSDGQEIYHTNVLMSIGNTAVVICDLWVANSQERKMVVESLAKSHTVIQLTPKQASSFAGNMLLLKNKSDEYFWVMSSQAFYSLSAKQKSTLETDGKIIHSDLKTIETIGGGSARCMIAELFY